MIKKIRRAFFILVVGIFLFLFLSIGFSQSNTTNISSNKTAIYKPYDAKEILKKIKENMSQKNITVIHSNYSFIESKDSSRDLNLSPKDIYKIFKEVYVRITATKYFKDLNKKVDTCLAYEYTNYVYTIELYKKMENLSEKLEMIESKSPKGSSLSIKDIFLICVCNTLFLIVVSKLYDHFFSKKPILE